MVTRLVFCLICMNICVIAMLATDNAVLLVLPGDYELVSAPAGQIEVRLRSGASWNWLCALGSIPSIVAALDAIGLGFIHHRLKHLTVEVQARHQR